MDEVSLSSVVGSNRSGENLHEFVLPHRLLVFDDPDDVFPSFLPPPPRPLFLSDAASDGSATCDLCSWAARGRGAAAIQGKEASGELGWVLTLVIVSLSSALIGAVIMIIALHCKSRLKNSSATEPECGMSMRQQRPPMHTPEDKEIYTITPANLPQNGNGVWSWLAKRSPTNLQNPPGSHQVRENHYTYNVEEALYAELDRESLERTSNESPAYQNSAYADADAPSAPSSAYYSDLSVTERAYEVLPSWDPCGLAAISENVNVTVPSDYV